MLEKTELNTARTSGLHDHIVSTFGRRIVTGYYEEGAPINVEVEIGEELGASRTATREALKTLTSKGLIRSRKKAGTFINASNNWNFLDPMVLQFSLEDERQRSQSIANFYSLRMGFEPEASALAAVSRTEVDVRELRRCLRIMAGYVDQKDRVESDFEFHFAILKSTGNPYYLSFGNLVSAGLKSIFETALEITAEDDDRWIKNHRDVADAIEDKDPEAARERMQHLLNSAVTP